MIFWISYVLAYLPFKILFPTKLKNKQNLIKGKSIYCCNHMTNFDIIIIGLFLKRRFVVLAKKELFKRKILAWYFKKLGAICVDRENVGLSTIKESIKALNNNKTLVIFPTGTRTDSVEEVDNLKEGVAKFAIMGKADIVPMMLEKKPKLFRKNVLNVGKPIKIENYLSQKGDKSIYKKISDEISLQMKNLLE